VCRREKERKAARDNRERVMNRIDVVEMGSSIESTDSPRTTINNQSPKLGAQGNKKEIAKAGPRTSIATLIDIEKSRKYQNMHSSCSNTHPHLSLSISAKSETLTTKKNFFKKF
jgi:hypothetical protein